MRDRDNITKIYRQRVREEGKYVQFHQLHMEMYCMIQRYLNLFDLSEPNSRNVITEIYREREEVISSMGHHKKK